MGPPSLYHPNSFTVGEGLDPPLTFLFYSEHNRRIYPKCFLVRPFALIYLQLFR